MKKLNLVLISLLIVPIVVFSQPSYDLTVDVNYPDRDLDDRECLQGATSLWRIFVKQRGSAYTNIASDEMVVYFSTNENASGFVIVTNRSVNTANGSFDVLFTSSDLNTNGSFWYTALLQDTNGNQYYSGSGELFIKKTTVTGSPSALNLSTPLNWDGFIFSSPGSAPMIVGTNLVAATNANGQVTVSATPHGAAILSAVVAGTNMIVVTSGGTATVHNANAYIAADVIVSNGVTSAFQAGDISVSNAFQTADTVVSNGVTSGYVAGETIVSNGVTSAFIVADTVVSNGLQTQISALITPYNQFLTNTSWNASGIVFVPHNFNRVGVVAQVYKSGKPIWPDDMIATNANVLLIDLVSFTNTWGAGVTGFIEVR